MKKYETLEIEIQDNIHTICLNRPDKHNAFDNVMLQELIDCFAELSESDAVCAVLRGRGKSFCAGADLKWMQNAVHQDRSQTWKDSVLLCQCFNDIYNCKIPTVAVVHGSVFGGANGLLAACDIVYSADDAVFAFSEIKMGLVPACISPFIIKRIGEFPAKELMLTGRRFGGIEAEKIGLVNSSVPYEQLEQKLDATLDHLKTSGPTAMKECKRLIYFVSNVLEFEKTIPFTAKMIADLRDSPEAQEGMNAFLEKRKPNWVK